MDTTKLIFIIGLVAVVGSLTSCRKTEWTKQEVVEWYAKCQSSIRGGLGYLGSDQQWHHFIARVFDEWVFIRIKKEEVKLEDERPVSRASNAPLTHYAVDPSRNFHKIEGKGLGEPDGPVNEDQPVRSGINRTSSAADSFR